jgi:putative acetyltransferase
MQCNDGSVNVPGGPVTVRAYVPDDAGPTLSVFLDAVTVTASTDYSPEQIVAWAAPDERNIEDWDRSRSSTDTVVAIAQNTVVGFSDVDARGYINMMFVDPRFSRRGVATALLAAVERHARDGGVTTLSTDASITARPFFEHHGFAVVARQSPVHRGIELTNYRMAKQLVPGSP